MPFHVFVSNWMCCGTIQWVAHSVWTFHTLCSHQREAELLMSPLLSIESPGPQYLHQNGLFSLIHPTELFISFVTFTATQAAVVLTAPVCCVNIYISSPNSATSERQDFLWRTCQLIVTTMNGGLQNYYFSIPTTCGMLNTQSSNTETDGILLIWHQH